MRRSLAKEMMDLPGNSRELLEGDLKNLRAINRAFGAYRGVIRCLDTFCRRNGMVAFSILDVGAGSGDMDVAIVRWAKQRRIAVKVVALDAHPVTAQTAWRHTKSFPEISVVRADGLRPPFSPRSFDFVLASQVLHHFSEKEIVDGLRTWAILARRGVLLSDLLRHPIAYYGIRAVAALFSRNRMTRIDAPLSVQRAFTLTEWRDLFQRADIGEFDLRSFFPFRIFACLSPKT